MARYIIPIDKLPNQKFNIELNKQRCEFEFLTRGVQLYMSLIVNDEPFIYGQICLNKVDLIQYNKAKFKGRVYFEDTQGTLDPLYYGLGERWILVYED